MTRRRVSRPPAILALGTVLGLSMTLLAAMVTSAAVPSTVDAYQSNGLSAAVHSSAGTNAFPNFASGAVDNRYPLVVVKQGNSPDSDAAGSVNDYGPLGATLITSDCNAPPPAPLPQPNPPPTPNYCLGQPVHDNAPYAHSQFPHPPGKGDDTYSANGGSATVHSEELESHGTGLYNGSGNEPTAPTVQNATASSKTIVNADGSIDITTHSHVGSAQFGGAGGLVVTNTDVQTEVKVANSKPVVTATVAPGTVTFAGQPVQVSDQGATVGGTGVPVVGGLGEAAGAAYHVNTVAPQKKTEGNRGTVTATGLTVTVIQPGDPAHGIPEQDTSYVLGEGYADAFASPSTNLGFDTTAPIGGTIADTFGSFPNGTSDLTGVAPDSLTTARTVPGSKTVGAARGGGLALGQLPFAVLFFIWEALVFAAAATSVYNRRRVLAEEQA